MTKAGIRALALAIMALLAGFAVPVSAQPPPLQCVANAGVPPIVRGEGFAEPVGDLTLNCTGGVPTAAGAAVPQVDVVVFLNTIGTRLALYFSSVPTGAAIFAPTVIYLYHQGDAAGLLNGDPTIYNPGHSSGVMVLTGTNANGAGQYNPVAGTSLHQVTNGLAVYEILYADPFGLEAADVPIVVSYDSTVLSNVNQTVQVAGGFAPFYFWFTGRPASHFGAAPDAPRFLRPANPSLLFSIAPN